MMVYSNKNESKTGLQRINAADKMLICLGAVAGTAAIGSFIFGFPNENEQIDANDPVIECAVNMLEVDTTIDQAELAISRCDSVGNLDENQIKEYGQIVLNIKSQSNG
jgi:hypothetical protein